MPVTTSIQTRLSGVLGKVESGQWTVDRRSDFNVRTVIKPFEICRFQLVKISVKLSLIISKIPLKQKGFVERK